MIRMCISKEQIPASLDDLQSFLDTATRVDEEVLAREDREFFRSLILTAYADVYRQPLSARAVK